MFHETLEEIEAEMFAQSTAPAAVLAPGNGMHVINGNAPRNRGPETDTARIAYKREHARLKYLEKVKAAILRGERPKYRNTKTWTEAAAELGVDLTAPVKP